MTAANLCLEAVRFLPPRKHTCRDSIVVCFNRFSLNCPLLQMALSLGVLTRYFSMIKWLVCFEVLRSILVLVLQNEKLFIFVPTSIG